MLDFVRLVATSVMVAFMLFMVGAFWGVFSSAHAQDAPAVLPEQSPFLTACQTARSLATISQLNMESCRRVSEVIEGNTALVTVRVKITDRGVFFVSVALMQTAWSQQAVEVRPA